MLHGESYRYNSKKDESGWKCEGEGRTDEKETKAPNCNADKYGPSASIENHIRPISEFRKDEKKKNAKEGTNKRIYAVKQNIFEPEICLSNKIIEDLTSKYKAELMPLNCRHSRRDDRRGKFPKKASTVIRNGNDLKSFSDGKSDGISENKKTVTFLDDKLRSGFANAAFVPSPQSTNETNRSASCEGIFNDGFVSSPAPNLENQNEFKKKPGRPKPIISPTEEFLLQLNEAFPTSESHRVECNGIDNEGFILSPDSSASIQHYGCNVKTESVSSNHSEKVKKRKGFVEQIKKISKRKSFSSEKENMPKQKKRSHSLLDRKKNENKFPGEIESAKVNLGKNENVIREIEEGKCWRGSLQASDDSEDVRFSFPSEFDEEAPVGRRLMRYSSMSKLSTQSRLNDAEFIEDFQNSSYTFGLGEKGMDFWVDGFKINNKKKVDKINKINIHLHALFSAVENGHVEKARTILESSDVDVNSLNGDHFTPLDVAVLTNHRSLAKMLVAFGAQEGSHFQCPDKLGNHLKTLLAEAERKVHELNGGLLTQEQGIPSNLNNNRASFSVSHYPASSITCHSGSGDAEKELLIWERRSKGLKKMLLGFNQTRPPEIPSLVAVDVTGTNSVTVRYQGPEHKDSSFCTKFKVQWSESENFDVINGEKEIIDVKCLECRINDLTQGKRHWFRVACGNLKGFGEFKKSTPSSVIPSSWRDVQGIEPRFSGRLHQLEDLFADIRSLRPDTASEIKDFSDQEKQGEALVLQKRNQKKKTIKQLFTVAGKFQKNLKRGMYLVCLFYHEDRILVTNEDFLPAIEVDETYPSSIYNDLHWFMKVACTWNDVKSLRHDMEKNLTSTTSHFRIKLLQAAQQMQSSLSTQDLGQLYFQPFRDAQGTLVFSSVNSCSSLKSISVLNLRWAPINKIQKKMAANEQSNVGELLMASIQSQIAYHRVSNLKLSKGLYLGYLKMKSSVDLIQIIVPNKTPNMLPHCKVRDNHHVSSEEWEWLKKINSRHKSLQNLQGQVKDVRELDLIKGSDQQQMFVEQVANTARKLFSYMDVSMEDAMLHRLYDVEVVELCSDVSFLIVVPPVETSCSVPGQKDILLERGDLMSVSLQVFEMVHLRTYQPEVISRYSRLSCILELDIILAQHSHREAFSSSEVQVAKDRLSQLQKLQIQLNGVWKSFRWIMNVITFARDRGATFGASSGSLQTHPKSTGVESSQSNLNKITSIQASSLSAGISSCGIQSTTGIPMKHLLVLTKKKEPNRKSPNRISKSKCLKENHQYVKCEKRSLLQIPDSPKDPKILKSNVSRGSWPGPGVDTCGSLLESSFSKSEQHINILGGETFESSPRKFSDCSSDGHYVNKQSFSNSSVGNHSFGKSGGSVSYRDAMIDIGNQLKLSRSEDHLFLRQEPGFFKEPEDCGSGCIRTSTTTATSVSATNSPLLPQRSLYGNNPNRIDGASLFSIDNTNVSGSLHSISSDESTAAVVSLPVTPYRSGIASSALNSVQHSASLMSLAKPIIPTNSTNHSKPKIPVTVSLDSLTEVANMKRMTSFSFARGGSVLSGNAIPVNINQKPLKTSPTLPDTNISNQNISSSLPSFPKHSGCGMTKSNPFVTPVSAKQRIQSPVKSSIKAVSPIDTVLAGASALKLSSAITVDPFIPSTLPCELDLLKHTGLPSDPHNSRSSAFTSIGHNIIAPKSANEINSESSPVPSSFLASGGTTLQEIEFEEDSDSIGSGIKVPISSSGVLQVYAAYETGLAAGTSLKLHVTPKTSAREVVDLVVKQLNMAVLLKGKDGPIYTADKLKNFCLVAVIGARERCLRDDFKPLQLQNPWKKGRLYVRQKQDVLAALEHSSRQSAFL